MTYCARIAAWNYVLPVQNYLVYSHLFKIHTQLLTSHHGFKNDLD